MGGGLIMSGWICLHRSLLKHWLSEDPDGMAVWVRLLLEANFETQKKVFNGSLIEVKRGELIYGRKAFSVKTGISEAKLRRIIKQLEDDGMISQQKTNKYSIISIANYDNYQVSSQQIANRSPADRQQIASKSPHYNNVNNVNNETSKDIKAAPVDFSSLNVSSDELDEIKRIRRKNKGGSLSQRVVNALAKEFQAARSSGWTTDEILTEWETRGWKSLKAEWLNSKKGGPHENYQQSRKLSVAERATAHRERAERIWAEQEANEQSVGEDDSHLRPSLDVEFWRDGD
jgi:DNA replication protein DnaD